MKNYYHSDMAKVVLEREKNAFYDGPDDPLYAASAAFQRDIEAQIEAAGGIESWREQHRKNRAEAA